MNENIGKPAFAQKIDSIVNKKKDAGTAVFGSALEDSDEINKNIGNDEKEEKKIIEESITIEQSETDHEKEINPKNKRGSKVLASSERFSDKENLKYTKYEKSDRSDSDKRNSSITYDIDLYFTLTDLKKFRGLKINEYCNNAIRQSLQKDYPEIYKKNKDLFGKKI